ncbi:hypothetical protein CXB51_029268 [Gossypium anomalum]|uniref:Gelsolin-like domain-containing protein n=1 Tax=Gossypium anomalum TaxID=47600 RepID=A0A8J5YC65_9ROSI|nr:hypothetical protein CXB51_029268 [Gossypium anomalum]
MGDSYIVLQTTPGKGGSNLYDIHFWIGKDTSQDEALAAAIKTVELDAVLGGRAVQHKELQGHESDKFLSYFKPCIIPLAGGIASGFKKPEEEEFQTRLYVCRGKRVVKLKQVPFARSSLNHDDVFILDTRNKIYQFNGVNSNIQERAKALEVVQFLKEKYHDGTCSVAIVGKDALIYSNKQCSYSGFSTSLEVLIELRAKFIYLAGTLSSLTCICMNIFTLTEDGELYTRSNSGEFWVLLGGFAPLNKKATAEDDVIPDTTRTKLYSITDGEMKPVEGELSKGLLGNNKSYLLDCGAEVFVWVGRATQVEDRKAASRVAEDFVTGENRAKTARITRVIQGYENNSFKSKFDSWPEGSTAPGGEEVKGKGKGKVAAFLKQQGVGARGTIKSVQVVEEVPALLEDGGKMEVWYINDGAKLPLPEADFGKFYSGDCYIVLYSYHSGERKEDYFLCCWIGKDSIEEDQKTAYQLATKISNSYKGRPVQGRVFEGKEPPQFITLFQPMVVLKGGLSAGYKKSIADKGLTDETNKADRVALFRISGTSTHNNKVLQVDAQYLLVLTITVQVATSLNSAECFLLKSGSSIYLWHGNQSTRKQEQLAAKVAAFLEPGVALKRAREGKESNTFWLALGGKKSYTSEIESSETIRDPHLFTFSLNKKGLFVEEVYNFSQDDLLTEDILILDTRAEVFVWVGQCVDVKEKENVFKIGQEYIDRASSLYGLSPKVPLYKVTEGNEPCFFTTFFSWDPNRATVHGNSYQKKLALLFGPSHVEELEAMLPKQEKTTGNQGAPTQRASALAALTSAFNKSPSKSPPSEKSTANQGGPTQRASALAALTNAFKSATRKSSTLERSPSNQSGSTQRAAALAALAASFNPSAETKTSAPKPVRSNPGGSQRAAAIAALSAVLTAEKKKQSPDVSPSISTSSTPAVTSPPTADADSSEVNPSEADDSVGVAKTNKEDLSEANPSGADGSQEVVKTNKED